MTKLLKVGVIGVGNMGRHHARIYHSLKNNRLVAIADVNERSGEEMARKFNCRYYRDYKKMLNQENLDAISVAVPTKLHKKVALDVIKEKINVLIEKPIASTVKEAEDIIEAARKNKVKLTVGHVERFNPAVRKLKEIIQQGKLGNIISIIAKRVGPFAPQIKDAGVLIDLAVHDIDIINYLLEKEPTKIYANGGKAINSYKEDYAEIFLNYGPISGYIQVNWITPVKIRELHITGTKGYAQLNYITQELNLYQSKYKKEFDDYGDFVIKFGSTKKVSIPVKFEEPLKLEIESFLKSVKENIKPEVTAGEALKSLGIALKALRGIKYA